MKKRILILLCLFLFCIAVSAQTKKEDFIDSCLGISKTILKTMIRFDSSKCNLASSILNGKEIFVTPISTQKFTYDLQINELYGDTSFHNSFLSTHVNGNWIFLSEHTMGDFDKGYILRKGFDDFGNFQFVIEKVNIDKKGLITTSQIEISNTLDIDDIRKIINRWVEVVEKVNCKNYKKEAFYRSHG